MLWVWTILRLLLCFNLPSWIFLHCILNHFNLDSSLMWLEICAPPNPRSKNGTKVQSTCKTSMNRDTGCWVYYFLSKSLISVVLSSAVSSQMKISYKGFTEDGCPRITQLRSDTKSFRKILKCEVIFCLVQISLKYPFWKKWEICRKCVFLAFCSDEGETWHAGVGSLNSLFRRWLDSGCGIHESLIYRAMSIVKIICGNN